jgi:hypothetical protein
MKILTAHDLKTGEVVYWSAAGTWTPCLAESVLMDDEAAAAALEAAEAAETVVVHVYLVPMDSPGAPVARERMRELLRARGPSTHPHFGKQAEQGA